MKFRGCGTALITPFRADGSLDEAALRRLIRWQIDSGIHFLVPCGTTGESPTLTRAEHLRVVEIAVEEAAGKTPIVAGCGGYNTAELTELARQLEGLGADGLLSVTPYYNKPTSEGLFRHYEALAAATRLPIVVYSVAGRTARNVTPAELARLEAIPNVVAVKEASGNVGQMAQICQQAEPDFAVLSGDDSLTLPLMSLGGAGLISVASNEIPGPKANFYETSPGPVKYAMSRMGFCEEVYRLPMVPIAAANKTRMDAVLAELELTA